MLTLTRCYNEEIIVTVLPSTEPVKIKIAYLGQWHKNRQIARIGVEAPKEVPILRGELDVVK
jgi:sRNA-binding carbon storage regulator CsrA